VWAPPIGWRPVLNTTRREGSLTAVERGAGLPPTDGAAGPRVVVFSDREVIAQGLVGLLPEDWRARSEIAVDIAALERAALASLTATIVDAGHSEVEQAARFTRSRGGSVIVLLGSLEEELSPALHHDADAIVVRDDVEPLTLRVALAAGRLGMRLVPRRLPPAPPGPDESIEHTRLDEPAKRALALLADGLRDAEIARELHLSESAVRKLIQRTVRRAGARTRCQAIAAAVRDGELS
jgi:DNA-binding NarL/FixJ family response regulator